MPRPKKQSSTKRDRRMTIYLTQQEESSLKEIADNLNQDRTKCVIEALNEWINRRGGA